MTYVASAVWAGGNVRVGLEDNLFLEDGDQATNAKLVERAVGIIGPDEVRTRLGLTERALVAA